MSFQPQVPMSGITGWRILQRTQARQEAAFDKSPQIARDVAYFTETIGKVTSAADLVADRRLLKVALGAFGLDSEIDKKAFIRKVLEAGTTNTDALAVKLTDPAYKKLSAAFGFGDAKGAQTAVSGFAKTITDAYKIRAFEAAIGESDDTMRLAMNFKREIADLAATGDKGGSWYSVIGSKSLSKVVEKAFGLPTNSFGKLDVDRQRDILRNKANALFGSSDLSVFKDSANVEKLINRFLARSQIDGSAANTSGTSAALTLLQGSSDGAQGIYNLLLSKG